MPHLDPNAVCHACDAAAAVTADGYCTACDTYFNSLQPAAGEPAATPGGPPSARRMTMSEVTRLPVPAAAAPTDVVDGDMRAAVRMPPAEKRRLKAVAALHGVTLTDYCIAAFAEAVTVGLVPLYRGYTANTDGYAHVNVHIPESLHRAMKSAAADYGVTLNAYQRTALVVAVMADPDPATTTATDA